MNDLLSKLDELAVRTYDLVRELELAVLPTHGFQFSVTSIGGGSSGFFYLNVEVETADGLRVTLGRRCHDGPTGSERFDADVIMSDLATTLTALSNEILNGDRRERLPKAIENSFAEARSAGLPLRMNALLQKPLRIGDTDGTVSFELLSTMRRDDLTQGGFSMVVTDAADFISIMHDEVLPEQHALAARVREPRPHALP